MDYNERKLQEIADHAAGFQAGPPVDLTKSIYYQYGQSARAETDTYYCGLCGLHVPITSYPSHSEDQHGRKA